MILFFFSENPTFLRHPTMQSLIDIFSWSDSLTFHFISHLFFCSYPFFFRLFISLFHSFCVLLACVCISTRVFLTITLLILFYFYFHWMIFCCITSKMWTYCCEFWSLQSKSSSDVWVCVRTQHMILIFYFQSFHLALRCCRYVKKTFSV